MTVERVYLIRHGQTAWNVDGRWQGFEPVPLNSMGLAQARMLASSLCAPISAIYTSDLQRAVQTAEALAHGRGLTPQTDIRLREFNLGIFQGLTNEEIHARYPQEAGGQRIHPLEGISLRPALLGRSLQRPQPIFWEHEGNRAVRAGQWKLVAKENEAWELYDIAADRTEMNNLAAKHPEKVKELSAQWELWAARAYVLPLGTWRAKAQ